jgi:hypothetical protein
MSPTPKEPDPVPSLTQTVAARRTLTPLARRIDTAISLQVDNYSRRAGINRGTLCAAAGCSPADLAAWRSGAAVPTQGQLARLAGALGVTFLWLRFGNRFAPITAPRVRS